MKNVGIPFTPTANAADKVLMYMAGIRVTLILVGTKILDEMVAIVF